MLPRPRVTLSTWQLPPMIRILLMIGMVATDETDPLDSLHPPPHLCFAVSSF